jgi:hypothetical protein
MLQVEDEEASRIFSWLLRFKPYVENMREFLFIRVIKMLVHLSI